MDITPQSAELGNLSLLVEEAVMEMQHGKSWQKDLNQTELRNILQSLIKSMVPKSPVPISVNIEPPKIENGKGSVSGKIDAVGIGNVAISCVLANSQKYAHAITTEQLDIRKSLGTELASMVLPIDITSLENDIRKKMASPNQLLFDTLKPLMASRNVDLAGLFLRFIPGESGSGDKLRIRLRPSTVPAGQ